MPASPDFLPLLKRVKSGDELALAQLIQEYGPAFRRAARGLIGNVLRPHLDSVDLVQSVEIILWQGLSKGAFDVNSPEQLLALAKALLRRRLARHWRRLKPPSLSATVERKLDGTVVDQALIADGGHSAEFDEAMEKLLSQLSDLDRRLVELRFLGYSTAEAARLMNVEPGFLRVRLGRLRERLRESNLLAGV